MNITTILPVSRIQYLDRIINSLLQQTYKANNLLVIYDGSEDDYAEARNKIVGLDFDSVRFVDSINLGLAFSIPDRRRHISNIHNQIRTLIEDTDYIFSIEDDGVLPPDALERLVKVMKNNDNVGLVTGVEIGRWGIPYVGAWTVDSTTNVTTITSITNKASEEPTTVDPIDACGLYCALIRADLYKEHEFFTDNGLGPDVNLGLFIRNQGFNNYIDWGIPISHLTYHDGQEIEVTPFGETRIVSINVLSASAWQASH